MPLVLKVLGSHLCTKSKKEWESTWNQLKAIPDEEITKKLQIAFNGLNTYERKLFLDIACFFKGEGQNRIADILESVCYSHNNIRNLINKSLIIIVGGKLWMHNLLQEMGWEIVRKESEEPERRSRLWLYDDVLSVLKNKIVSGLSYRHNLENYIFLLSMQIFAISCLIIIIILGC